MKRITIVRHYSQTPDPARLEAVVRRLLCASTSFPAGDNAGEAADKNVSSVSSVSGDLTGSVGGTTLPDFSERRTGRLLGRTFAPVPSEV